MASSLPPVKNAAFTFYVALVSQADTDIFKTSVTLAAGDVKVSKDGGAFANVASLPTEIGTSGVLSCPLSANEMNADVVVVKFTDAAGAEWQDALVTIYTAAQTLDTTDGVADGIKTKTDYLPSATAGAAGGVAIVGSEMGLTDSAITSAKFASGAITAAAIAADAIGASELATDAVAEIWSYTTRTLTQSSTSTTDSTAAGSISRRRGDSWSISLTLGAITGYTSLWLTVKSDTTDADTASLLMVKKNASGLGDGLIYVNGAAASDAIKASITVSDATTGAIVIAVDESITDDLTPGAYSYDVQVLISGAVSTPDSGTFTVTADVTRAIA